MGGQILSKTSKVFFSKKKVFKDSKTCKFKNNKKQKLIFREKLRRSPESERSGHKLGTNRGVRRKGKFKLQKK